MGVSTADLIVKVAESPKNHLRITYKSPKNHLRFCAKLLLFFNLCKKIMDLFEF